MRRGARCARRSSCSSRRSCSRRRRASSRVQFGALNVREVDVKDAAARAVERAGLPPEKLKLDSSAKTIQADPTLLARALANLLENAKKHAGGAESLHVRDEPGKIVF